jgi:hypothetical protein
MTPFACVALGILIGLIWGHIVTMEVIRRGRRK